MKFLILVACSVLILSSCNSSIDEEVTLEFPVNISGFYEDMMKSTRHPMWGGPIKVFESERSLVFQISGSKDIFLLDAMGGDVLKAYPNPPDTIGGMVYRRDPVSFVIPNAHGFDYLKNNSKLIHLSDFAKLEDTYKIVGDNLTNPFKILHLLDNRLISYWWGISTKESSSTGGVYFTDLSSNSTKKIIPADKIERMADLTISDEKIYVLEKYRPLISIYDFEGTKLQIMEMPKSNYLKYQKLVRPPGYLQMTPEDKVAFLEDNYVDMYQQGDTTFVLYQTYFAENQSLKEKYILTIFSDGKLKEKVLDIKPLNFSLTGDVYFFSETDSGEYLMKKPISQFF
ncbi:hypothetical protein [Algoriphagus yeomjeoni]|nr:hypothetical protein [Algoriphagus yeomjeoni]